jgi:hypothetical protein
MLKLFSSGVIGTILVGSLGINIYSYIGSKNIEDIEKDKFAFGWFVSTIVLAILLAIIGVLLIIFIPFVSPTSKDYGCIWASILNGLALVSSAFVWDLTTRTKTDLEAYRDRKVFIFSTILFIILFLMSLSYIPFK